MASATLHIATAPHPVRYAENQHAIAKAHLAAALQHMVAAYDHQQAASEVKLGNLAEARQFAKTAGRHSEAAAELSDDVTFLYEDWII
jgi:hypothetical protein